MRGGSDDSRTPDDEPSAVDAGWEALIGETGKDDGDLGQDDAQPVTEDHVATTEGAAEPVEPAPAKAVLRAGPVPGSAKVIVRIDPDPAKARRSSGSLRVVGAPVTPAVRASRPTEPSLVEPASRRVPWLGIGVGVLAIATVAYVANRDPQPSSRRRTGDPTIDSSRPQANMVEVGTTTRAEDPTSTDADPGVDESGEDPEVGGTKAPKPRADPREPPPGTPPEIAAVFRRLPVGPADRAPVGGVGATGIHVDHIAMGTDSQGLTCRGRADDFSVSGGDRPGVCVRVVHAREKEELQVLWEKKGGSTRRSKMVVLPMHAYRTRGYLVLRNEYIGDWTVHIVSSDGVELARHDFTVVP